MALIAGITKLAAFSQRRNYVRVRRRLPFGIRRKFSAILNLPATAARTQRNKLRVIIDSDRVARDGIRQCNPCVFSKYLNKLQGRETMPEFTLSHCVI